ncbi:hypothetical protein PoB_004937200 [Plakobranchus ocellatus]|uniref:ISXO2-like transposase domain-containing protein n=1 Tax=Plakobranchus ocellatus TaxID=259542 RepID=A0AAV4BTZ5_9GAST|nr:hypothetical protein PoB_004937200 [Plakobranchus ocellatus]
MIYSDSWGVYSKLKELNYTPYQINHSQNFVDPDNAAVHTQNIERLWRDIKDHVKRPGIHPSYLYQYLARYLFISDPTITSKNGVHYFVKEATRLYPPQGGRPASLVGGACENPSLPIATSSPIPQSPKKLKTDCPKCHLQPQCNVNLNASCKELSSNLSQQRKTVAEIKKKYQVRVVTQKYKRFNIKHMELERQISEHKKLNKRLVQQIVKLEQEKRKLLTQVKKLA